MATISPNCSPATKAQAMRRTIFARQLWGGPLRLVVTIWDDDGGRIITSAVGPNEAAAAPTDAEIDAAVAAARSQWIAAGGDAALLEDMIVVLADLDGLIVAETVGSTIYLDLDAAGWNWHVNPAASVATDRIDLVTVLTHEIGHVLGHDHGHDHGVMAGQIAPGSREVLAAADSAHHHGHAASAAATGTRSLATRAAASDSTDSTPAAHSTGSAPAAALPALIPVVGGAIAGSRPPPKAVLDGGLWELERAHAAVTELVATNTPEPPNRPTPSWVQMKAHCISHRY